MQTHPTKTCSVDGCEKRIQAKGFCNSHYMRRQRHGNPLAGRRSPIPHGHARTPVHRAWLDMWQRCSNQKNRSYPRYGGRSISVYEEWRDFATFLADMGERPGPEYSLDRIDNDGNYEPSNCRWATAEQQQRNKRPFRRPARKGAP